VPIAVHRLEITLQLGERTARGRAVHALHGNVKHGPEHEKLRLVHLRAALTARQSQAEQQQAGLNTANHNESKHSKTGACGRT
jgi:hypothetical protein